MATLYLGRIDGPGGFERLIAIKAIHDHLSHDKSFVSMFLDEARTIARIHHPNVVRVFEVGDDSGRLFLAMDFIRGETLTNIFVRTWGRNHPLDIPLAAYLISTACEALHAAHELRDNDGEALGVIHRDVTPENLIVGYDGFLRVVDFGVAKAADQISTTDPGLQKGKVAYMAPEQVESRPLDRRVDVFALGVILWEAIVGRRLFKSENVATTVLNVLEAEIVSPASIRPECDEELARIVLKALNRDAAGRYQTARELGRDLQLYLGHKGTLTGPADVELFMRATFADRYATLQDLVRRASQPIERKLALPLDTSDINQITDDKSEGVFRIDEATVMGAIGPVDQKPEAPRGLATTVSLGFHHDVGSAPHALISSQPFAQPSRLPGRLPVGFRLESYRVERHLASTGVYDVYAAVHAEYENRAVIKVFSPKASSRPELVQRFNDDLSRLRSLKSAHIVQIWSTGCLEDGRIYLVMERASGLSLREVLQAGKLSMTDRLRVLEELAMVLDAGHEAGVVHRDLKPEHVFLASGQGNRPTVKLLGYGVATLRGGLGNPLSSESPQNRLYRAPEQVRIGEIVSTPADVYALGMIAYELLLGVGPFGETPAEAIWRNRPSVVNPKDIREDVSDALAEMLVRMLARKPEERPRLGDVRAEFAEHRHMIALSEALGQSGRGSGSKRPLLLRRFGSASDLFEAMTHDLSSRLLHVTAPNQPPPLRTPIIVRYAVPRLNALVDLGGLTTESGDDTTGVWVQFDALASEKIDAVIDLAVEAAGLDDSAGSFEFQSSSMEWRIPGLLEEGRADDRARQPVWSDVSPPRDGTPGADEGVPGVDRNAPRSKDAGTGVRGGGSGERGAEQNSGSLSIKGATDDLPSRRTAFETRRIETVAPDDGLTSPKAVSVRSQERRAAASRKVRVEPATVLGATQVARVAPEAEAEAEGDGDGDGDGASNASPSGGRRTEDLWSRSIFRHAAHSSLVHRTLAYSVATAVLAGVALMSIVASADHVSRTSGDDRIDMGVARAAKTIVEERLRRMEAEMVRVAATGERGADSAQDFADMVQCEGARCQPLVPSANANDLGRFGAMLDEGEVATRLVEGNLVVGAKLADRRRAMAVVRLDRLLPGPLDLFGSEAFGHEVSVVAASGTGDLLSVGGRLGEKGGQPHDFVASLVALPGSFGVEVVTVLGRRELAAWAKLQDLVLVVTGPSTPRDGLLWSRLIGWVLLVILLVALVSAMLSARVALRLRQLQENALAVAAGDFQREIRVRGQGPLAELARSFAMMTRALRARDEDVRRRQHAMSEAEAEALQRKISDWLRKDLSVTLESIDDVVKAPIDEKAVLNDLKERRAKLKELVTRASLSLNQVLALAGVAGRRVDAAALVEDVVYTVRRRYVSDRISVDFEAPNAVLFPRLEVQESDLRELVEAILNRMAQTTSVGESIRVALVLEEDCLHLEVQAAWSEVGLLTAKRALEDFDRLVVALGASAAVRDDLTVLSVHLRFPIKSRSKLKAA
ncbi:MAG: protein kinase [Deltaproteobacteria bacterium]|nr:protein kinase [Deltaproteobacteria bacterium]